MSEKTCRGSCLCGEVSYEIEGPFKIFQYCHCSRCRKFTGSDHASNLFVPPERFRWLTGETQVGRYEHPDAKYFATTFCKQCGSSLPWAVQGGRNIVVTAGTLDEDPEIRPMWNIFWSSRADWLHDTDSLPKFDKFPHKRN
ncbi:MAG: GFA family protein [Thiotrichales bacterium]|nr:GFA family protein [Thiotrichales bacterium]